MFVRKLQASEQDGEEAEDQGFVGEEEIENPDEAGDEDDVGAVGEEEPDAGQQGDEPEQRDEVAAARARRRSIEERAERVRDREPGVGDQVGQAVRSAILEQDAAARRREDERRESDIVAGMTEDQRTLYLTAKQGKNAEQTARAATVMAASAADQSRFDRLLMRRPEYEKYEEEIERRHQAELAKGNCVPRTELLKHYIGDLALRQTRAKEQRGAGQRRIQQQRGAGQGARGNVRQQGGGSGKTLVSRAEEADWSI